MKLLYCNPQEWGLRNILGLGAIHYKDFYLHGIRFRCWHLSRREFYLERPGNNKLWQVK